LVGINFHDDNKVKLDFELCILSIVENCRVENR